MRSLSIFLGGFAMPKYIANAYLKHEDKIYQTGSEIELTQEQAKVLGEKVTITEEGKLEGFTVDELKEQAKVKGLTGFSDLKKGELIKELAKKE